MFKKGQSGNPNGRKPKAAELKLVETIVKAGGGEDSLPDLWEKIWSQAREGSKDHQQMILQYAYGKPAQHITADVKTAVAPTFVLEKAE